MRLLSHLIGELYLSSNWRCLIASMNRQLGTHSLSTSNDNWTSSRTSVFLIWSKEIPPNEGDISSTSTCWSVAQTFADNTAQCPWCVKAQFSDWDTQAMNDLYSVSINNNWWMRGPLTILQTVRNHTMMRVWSPRFLTSLLGRPFSSLRCSSMNSRLMNR